MGSSFCAVLLTGLSPAVCFFHLHPPMPHFIVLTTTATEQQAADLARSILDAHLAACVQIQAIRSFYRWKGELINEPEWRLTIKTAAHQRQAVEAHIKAHHTYETPQIVWIDLGGSAEYIRWLDESLLP